MQKISGTSIRCRISNRRNKECRVLYSFSLCPVKKQALAKQAGNPSALKAGGRSEIPQAENQQGAKADCGTEHPNPQDLRGQCKRQADRQTLCASFTGIRAGAVHRVPASGTGQLSRDSARADKFIEIVKKHTDFSELTPQMIAEYIEKIVVHEADKSSGERQQQVDIYLNFIGRFEVPAPAPTAEEIEAEEKARRRREQCREAQRRYAARQKQKAQEQEQAAQGKGA